MQVKFIPLSVPNLKGNELAYVTHAVETEWVSTGGPFIDEFERRIAEYVGVEGAVSVQNGTSGLHVALQLCGVTAADEVLVPTLTFIAAVNPVKYIGAEPVFMDCDDSLCMDVEKLEAFCREQCTFADGKLTNNVTRKTIKAILVVHVFGNMADMAGLMQIAETYGLPVVEDATEALGSYYTEGPYAGKHAGTIGAAGVYSFNGNKIMTTGGGGMIVSNDEDLLRRARHLTTQAKSDELYYIHDEIGYNYRMTNLQAAVGLAQLERLEAFIETKRDNYHYYQSAIREVEGLAILDFDARVRSNYWFYSLFVGDDYSRTRDEVISYLASKRVQTRPIWGLIHEQKPYIGSQAYRIEKAKHYWKHVVNIPCSSNLSREEAQYVVDCLRG